MIHVEMESWRSFFQKSREDIWTVIHHAITLAAVDYPKDFRVRRDEIAETLFDRSLLQRYAKDDFISYEEGVVREAGPAHTLKAPGKGDDVVLCRQQHVDVVCRPLHDDAEALSDELEEEALILRDLNCIKGTLVDVDQPETVILEALQRLQYMQITVENLKATEIGKPVKSLKKHPSKRVQSFAKELMRQWKILIDEWIESAKNVTATATTTATGTGGKGHLEVGGHGAGLLSPPLDEGALLEATASHMDLSQIFSFADGGDICPGIIGSQIPLDSIEPSVKDNLSYSCRSHSESMPSDSNEFDTKATTSCPWGLTLPEERGSATRDNYPPSGTLVREAAALKGQASSCSKSQIDGGRQVLKGISNGSGPGRPCNEISKSEQVSGLVSAKPTSNGNRMSGSKDLHNNGTTHASNADKSFSKGKQANGYCGLNEIKNQTVQVDEKLEIAKRKLHQGYQQAENAKRQRTVQILSSSELPKPKQAGKDNLNSHVHNRELFASGHGGKARTSAPVHNRELAKSGQVGKAKMIAPIQNKASMQIGQCSQNRKFP